MTTIELDGASWLQVSDFYDSILLALGAPAWHGKNVNALIDSIIYGGINRINPPLIIKIRSTQFLSKRVMDELGLAQEGLHRAHVEILKSQEKRVDVRIEIYA